MRRSIATLVVALSAALAISMLPSTSTAAGGSDGAASTAPVGALAAHRALDLVKAALADKRNPSAAGSATKVDPTLALRDLRLALPSLNSSDRRAAGHLLARPTQGGNDPYGDGYTVKAKRMCNTKFCIHWVPRTKDAPPSHHWVVKMLRLMTNVYRKEVGQLHYRKPISDGSRGGSRDKFDVYLKDLYPKGYYGYCAPDPDPTSYNDRLYSGYCVLDNNFARREYGAPPMASASVTAAHEFFHAIQFAYDTGEDRWMMESTATWMEERFNDKSNDNRQYLGSGQLRQPNLPLDYYNPNGFSQYANWLYFEYLSEHYGNDIVHQIWTKAAAKSKRHNRYSTKAIVSALSHHGGFRSVFARYAAGNTIPSTTYSEGSHYHAADLALRRTLTKTRPSSGAHRYGVRHMGSVNVRIRPAKELLAKAWHVRIRLDGPGRAKSPAAYVIVHRRHRPLVRKLVHLSRRGKAHLALGFSHRTVKYLTITMANASTKFRRCGTGTVYSCQGLPRFPRTVFRVSAVAFRK
jgi:hypothetical protein